MLLAVSSALMSSPNTLGQVASVGAIFLRFNGPQEKLELAVRSILADQFDSEFIGEVLLIDNASTDNPEAVEAVAALIGDPRIRVIRHRKNFGFAGGVNRGIGLLGATITSVLLMNDDATLHSGALAKMVVTLRAVDSDVVAVAPKLYLESFPGIVESCGMVVNARAEARNNGLGQFDIGQFEVAANTLGPSFAAGLFRRSAFNADEVGLLEEEYFLYYEDVEWNWRANLFGYRSITCPAATGTHAVSASSRDNDGGKGSGKGTGTGTGVNDWEVSYAFKHRFIETNLLATAARCLEGRAAVKVWAHRFPRLVKGRITGRFPKASFGAAVDSVRRLRKTLTARRKVQQRRLVADAAILSFSDAALPILFDPVTYLPNHTWAALDKTATAAAVLARTLLPVNADSIARFEAISNAAARRHHTDCQEAFARPVGDSNANTVEHMRAFEQYIDRLT